MTAKARIIALREFFSWIDRTGTPVCIDNVGEVYLKWAEHLHHRQRFAGAIRATTAHNRASTVAAVLNRVLGRRSTILGETRVRKPKAARRFHKAAADKVALAETFRFGQVIADLCYELTTSRLCGQLPLTLNLRAGPLELWSRLAKPAKPTPRKTARRNKEARISAARRAAYIDDISLRTRSPLINLRIEARTRRLIDGAVPLMGTPSTCTDPAGCESSIPGNPVPADPACMVPERR